MKRAADVWNACRSFLKKGMQAYSAFMEKQGFYLVLTVCVLVIVGTAVWTRASKTPERPPATDAGQEANMPYEGVERLADVTPHPSALRTPAPTPAPSFLRPVQGAVLRGFDAARPVFFKAANMWQVHCACDYAAKAGDVVKAMGEGTVTAIADSGAYGKSVTVDHGSGIVATYAGLSMNSYVKVGDPVTRGQTIGHAGNSTMAETGDGPHLHLSVKKADQWIDPETLFPGNIS